MVRGAVYIRGGSVWQGLFCKKKRARKFTCQIGSGNPDTTPLSQQKTGDPACLLPIRGETKKRQR
jgi:hypothetical protein